MNTKQDDSPPHNSPWIISHGLSIVTFLSLALSLISFFFPSDKVRIESATYLAIAIIAIALPKIKKFVFGKEGLSVETISELKESISDVKKQGEAVLEMNILKSEKKFKDESIDNSIISAFKIGPVTVDNDPQKGRFGGKSEVNGKKITATVTQTGTSDDIFFLFLRVSPSRPGIQFNGNIYFFLHDTFNPNVRRVEVVNGIASLDLLAWGAFTVGVVADEGNTLLELDLSGHEVDAPQVFKAR